MSSAGLLSLLFDLSSICGYHGAVGGTSEKLVTLWVCFVLDGRDGAIVLNARQRRFEREWEGAGRMERDFDDDDELSYLTASI